MGHAGAIVAPGQAYGTFKSKKEALERARVTVVNSQYDLIEAVKTKLKKTYFDPERYYQKMQHIWEAKVEAPTWGTLITEVKPNNIMISGYALQQIVGRKGLLDMANLLIQGEFATPEFLEELQITAMKGALKPEPSLRSYEDEDISQALARAHLRQNPSNLSPKRNIRPHTQNRLCFRKIRKVSRSNLGKYIRARPAF